MTYAFSGGKKRDDSGLLFDPSGSMLTSSSGFLWDLTAQPEAEPMRLTRAGFDSRGLAFDPNNSWLATSTMRTRRVSLWPLVRTYPLVLRGHEG